MSQCLYFPIFRFVFQSIYIFFSSLQNKIQSFFNGSHVCSNIKMKNDFVAHNLIMKKDRCKNDTIRRNEMRDFSIQNILTA